MHFYEKRCVAPVTSRIVIEKSYRRKPFGYPDAFEIPGFRVALAIASLPGMTIGGRFAAENTALVIFMMELGAEHGLGAVAEAVKSGGQEHPGDGCRKVDP